MKNPRSTAEQIRSYILQDLTEAISKLDIAHPDAEYGRATKGSAYALRGKVYLYNKEWNNAISDFEEIIYNKTGNYGYGLHANYGELFRLYGGKKSNETIFAIQNKGGAGNPYGLKLSLYLGNVGSFGRGWNNSVPSRSLVDMYEYPDGKPFDWDDTYPGYNDAGVDTRKDLLQIKLTQNGKSIESLLNADTAKILNVYKNRDPRLMASVIVPYSTYTGWQSNASKELMFVLHSTENNGGTPDATNGFIPNNNSAWTTYLWRKFVPEANLGGAITDRTQNPIEFPLIRFADVLLMLSEAYNETGQLDKAITELNKVRTRTSVNMPALNSGPSWLAVTTKEEMTERIRKERAVELSCEGHRFSDLRRWGIAKTILAKRPAESIYGSIHYFHEFTDRDMLWPIPSVEIERNPLLEQNPGWN
jgi:tetratricopeptide (TPR) repeat protein